MAKKVIYMLDRFNDRLIWAVKYFLCAVLTLQVCLIFVSVVMRYFLNRPLSWSDEMATFMLVYVTFLGTYVASNTGHLAKVELFISLFKGPLHTAAKILSRIFSAGLVGWIGFYGTKMYFSNIIQNQFRHADSDAVCLVDPAGDNVAAAFFGSAGISAYIYSKK